MNQSKIEMKKQIKTNPRTVVTHIFGNIIKIRVKRINKSIQKQNFCGFSFLNGWINSTQYCNKN